MPPSGVALWWIRADAGVGWVRDLVGDHPLVTADRSEAAQLESAAARQALRRIRGGPVRWHLLRVPEGTPPPSRHGEPTA